MSYTEKYQPLRDGKTENNKLVETVIADAIVGDELVITSPEQLAWLLMVDWDGEVVPASLLKMTLDFFNLQSADQLVKRSSSLFGPTYLAQLSEELSQPTKKPFKISVVEYQRLITEIEEQAASIPISTAREWEDRQKKQNK